MLGKPTDLVAMPARPHSRAGWLSVALSALVLLAVAAAFPGLIGELEENAAALAWRVGASQTPERRVIVVDVDDESVARVGPWPWPRERLTELSDRLAAEGASLQLYDVVFPDAAPGDAEFAAALRKNGGVLAQVFDFEAARKVAGGQLRGAADLSCGSPFPAAHGYIANAAALDLPAGHISPLLGPDGAVRRMPALVCHQDRAYPALAIAGLMAAAPASAPQVEPGQGPFAAPWLLSFKDLPGIRIPLDADGAIRLPYGLHPDALAALSAADVLQGRVPADMLRGAWVVIGGSAFGIKDAVPTPFGGAVAGVSVHAQLLAALLDNRVPYGPARGGLLQFALAAAGALLLLRLRRAGAVWLPLVGAGLAIAFALLGGTLLLRHGLWLGWGHAALFCLLLSLVLTMAGFARTRREREHLFANLASYLPAAVAENLALRAPDDAMRAERRDCVALYADLRNFSAYCEARPPEEAAAVLHAFFSTADRIVEHHGGRVESLQGDALLALWPHADSGAAALAAAKALLADAPQWLPDSAAPGLEPLALGIGIEAGPVLVGFFGGARRRAYTALGEPVTVARRLQSMTSDLAEPLLLGPVVVSRLEPGSQLADRGIFLLEGLAQMRHVYAPAPQEARP